MKNENLLLKEELLWPGNQRPAAASQAESAGFVKKAWMYISTILKKTFLVLKRPGVKAPKAPDPAVAIIMQISDAQLRHVVKELHYLTPTSLKTMRGICQECFILPEDCPYIDYSIPDVNKAIKRINAHPVFSSRPDLIINELAKVNDELTRHLRDHFELDDDVAQA